MKTIRLKNPNPLPNQNEADVAKYGRSYWSFSSDLDLPVKFNLMGDTELHDGSMITYEEWVNKESAKGTEYLQLKKVKVQGAEQISMSTSTHTPKKEWQPRDDSAIQAQWAINQSREYIQFKLGETSASLTEILDTAKLFYGMIDQVKGGVKEPGLEKAREVAASLPRKQDTVIEDIGDEPINLDDIPF